MNLDEFSKKPKLDEKDEGKHNNGKTTGFKAVAKKAASEYGSKEAGERVAGAVRNKMKKAGKIEEETGDPKFDSMMGKISSSDAPQNFDQARADKVQAGAENPDEETIKALNKMMYDMHVTMMTANKLMQKLTQGR